LIGKLTNFSLIGSVIPIILASIRDDVVRTTAEKILSAIIDSRATKAIFFQRTVLSTATCYIGRHNGEFSGFDMKQMAFYLKNILNYLNLPEISV
jgi:hypothetical protein